MREVKILMLHGKIKYFTANKSPPPPSSVFTRQTSSHCSYNLAHLQPEPFTS